MSYFFVIDNFDLVPDEGYESRPLQHDEAADLLRGKTWFWYLENKEGETFHRLRALATNSGLKLDVDTLEDRELKDPKRLKMGAGHMYLVIVSPGLSYFLFSPVDAAT